MNLPNIKDVLKIALEKLSVLRNNISVMISIIITFVALLLFIPTQLFSSGLRKQIQSESIDRVESKITRLEKVSDEDLLKAQGQLDKVVAEVNDIELKAINATRRELLSDDIFDSDPNDPNGSVSTAIFYDFGKEYCTKIDQFLMEYNAVTNKLVDEIDVILDEKGIDDILENRSTYGGGNTMSVEGKLEGMMIEHICKNVAESSFVFIDPVQISGYSYWSQYQYNNWNEDVNKCWYSQLGYWIIEDVFDTIVAVNEGHESLVTAPVKRLMKIYFTEDYKNEDFIQGSSKGYVDIPQYIFSTVDVPQETLTGRYCDENYDVVHFNAKFVVKTSDLPLLLKELCSAKEHEYIDESGQAQTYQHNQITILGMTVKSIYMNSEDHALYWYGDSDVSEVDIACEYLFNKKGYEDVMPQTVKNFFEPSEYDY